jgi:hypothetical protein
MKVEIAGIRRVTRMEPANRIESLVFGKDPLLQGLQGLGLGGAALASSFCQDFPEFMRKI